MTPTNTKKCPHPEALNSICDVCSSSANALDAIAARTSPPLETLLRYEQGGVPLTPVEAERIRSHREGVALVTPSECQRRAAAAHHLGVDSTGNPPSYTEHWVKTGENVRTERGLTVSAGPVALARLLAEREAKLRAKVDTLEQSEHDVHVAIYECLTRAPAMGVRLHIDGEPDRMARDVVDWVKAATKVLEGRDVVSLATFHRVEAERDTLRARVAEWEVQHGIDRASVASMAESIKRHHDREALADIKAAAVMTGNPATARTPIVRCGECTAAVGHFGDCVKGGAL